MHDSFPQVRSCRTAELCGAAQCFFWCFSGSNRRHIARTKQCILCTLYRYRRVNTVWLMRIFFNILRASRESQNTTRTERRSIENVRPGTRHHDSTRAGMSSSQRYETVRSTLAHGGGLRVMPPIFCWWSLSSERKKDPNKSCYAIVDRRYLPLVVGSVSFIFFPRADAVFLPYAAQCGRPRTRHVRWVGATGFTLKSCHSSLRLSRPPKRKGPVS